MDTSCRTAGCVGRLDLADAADALAGTSPIARATCPICRVGYEITFNAGRIAKVEPLAHPNGQGDSIHPDQAASLPRGVVLESPTAALSNATETRASRAAPPATHAAGVHSQPSSAMSCVRPATRVNHVKAVLAVGALLALLIVVTVSHVTSHKTTSGDVMVQSCVVQGSGAEATALVVNHGSGTASYLFDLVFSQNQSALVGVPLRTTALRAGNTATLHAFAGSIDTSRAVACTIANLQRLPGG
jgi:hypothetical protein